MPFYSFLRLCRDIIKRRAALMSRRVVRVVEVKLARAQGVHDDVEDTKLTGG